MGVSQWKNAGKKYGYWDYFQQELIKQIEEKADTIHGWRTVGGGINFEDAYREGEYINKKDIIKLIKEQ